MAEDLFDVEQVKKGESPPQSSIVLRLYVQPGAGKPAVVGRRADALHVRVAPPPVDGRANVACLELVAELFDVGGSDVELVGGEHNRAKRVRVRGVDEETARRVLDTAVAEAESGTRGSKGPRSRR